MLNGFFGLSAMLLLVFDFGLSTHIKFHIVFVLILMGLLADGLDGILARRFGKGTLGVYFEAMSDMTTMGITPTIVIAFLYTSTFQEEILYVVILCFLLLFYLCAAFIRLASFHPLKDQQVFIGFPASATTMFLLSSSFLIQSVSMLFIIIFISACLMILPISFPKPTKMMNIFSALIIILTVIIGFFYSLIYILLFCSVLLYMIGGKVYLRFSK
jgi:CDP-diacylglycerol--serine O-phosphatidyltransferase